MAFKQNQAKNKETYINIRIGNEMKCIILAGGTGDKMWPLSRREYPKQFMNIKEERSLLQETVGRNMPICDEFFIMANANHSFIIDGQMEVFQGLKYRCFYETIAKGTALPVVLACMSLNPSEMIYVLNSDHFVDGNTYQTEVIKAKDLVKNGEFVAFGAKKDEFKSNYHYFFTDENGRLEKVAKYNTVSEYESDCNSESDCKSERTHIYVNTGMFMCQVGDLLNDIKLRYKDYYETCRRIVANMNTASRNIYIYSELLGELPSMSIEEMLYSDSASTYRKHIVYPSFKWSEVASFDVFRDYSLYGYSRNIIKEDCNNTTIINQDTDKIVVGNKLDDLYVVNTKDAIYVSKKENAGEIKGIIEKATESNDEKASSASENTSYTRFFERGSIVYRTWGYRETLTKAHNYYVRKVVLFGGMSIFPHVHSKRSEQWAVLDGELTVLLDNQTHVLRRGMSIGAADNVLHMLANNTNKDVVFIETSIDEDESIDESDIIRRQIDGDIKREINKSLIKLSPAYKDYIWGGTKLRDIYGKNCDYDRIAESWELSAHESGPSIVASGEFKGRTFNDYLRENGKKALGWKADGLDRFPILIKIIDAKEDLSIQIHPDDEYALKYENELGKNELWYVMDCEENSYIYWGLKKAISADELKRMVENNTIENVLNKVKVKKGDVIFVEAGTIHAIGAGIMILEIQQNSNCTYRLYDYDRMDKYGNTRELHLDKALAVFENRAKADNDVVFENNTKNDNDAVLEKNDIAFGNNAKTDNDEVFEKKAKTDNDVVFENNSKADNDVEETEDFLRKVIARCKYFQCDYYMIKNKTDISIDTSSFKSFIILSGNGHISDGVNSFDICAGESYFMPATDGEICIEGKVEVIVTHI